MKPAASGRMRTLGLGGRRGWLIESDRLRVGLEAGASAQVCDCEGRPRCGLGDDDLGDPVVGLPQGGHRIWQPGLFHMFGQI